MNTRRFNLNTGCFDGNQSGMRIGRLRTPGRRGTGSSRVRCGVPPAGPGTLEALEQRAMLAADLTVRLTSPLAGTFDPGQGIVVGIVERNIGNATADNYTTRVILSVNTVWGDDDDYPLSGGQWREQDNGGLPPGGTASGGLPCWIPYDLPPGHYHLMAKIDADGAQPAGEVFESNEDNNVFCTATAGIVMPGPPMPDLVISGLNVPGSRFFPGQVVNATAVYRNIGTASSAPFSVRFVASVNNIYGDSDDIELFAADSPAGLRAGQTLQSPPTPITIPTAVPGDYYIIGRIDPGNAISEIDETNNQFIRAGRVTLLPPPAPDLTVSALGAPSGIGRPGQTVTVPVTIRNTGTGPCGPFSVRLLVLPRIPSDNGAEVQSVTVNTDGLAAGASRRVMVPLQLAGNFAPGVYFLQAQADNTAEIAESNETNNAMGSSSPVLTVNGSPTAPDLSITSVTSTVGALTRDRDGRFFLTATAVIRNQGTVAVGDAGLAFTLSANTVLGDADDIALDIGMPGGGPIPVGPGGTVSVTQVLTLPDGVAPGAYRLLASTDPQRLVSERNEANNLKVSPTTVTVPTPPDLTVTFQQFTNHGPNAALHPGDYFTGDLTLRNIGQEDANAAFDVNLYLSNDTVFDASDLLIWHGTQGTVGGVSLHGGQRRVFQLLPGMIPFAAMPGTYRVIAVVDPHNGPDDASGAVSEGNESNNTYVSPTDRPTVIAARDTATDPVLPNFSAWPMPAAGGTYMAGDSIYGCFALFNNATTSVARPELRAVLSRNAILGDGDDVLLSNDVLTASGYPEAIAGTTALLDGFLRVPDQTPGGTYTLWLTADPANTIAETNETDNSSTWHTTIRVLRPSVAVAATDPAAAETLPRAPVNKGVFTITRTGPLTASLDVSYTIGGTAAPDDYDTTGFTGTVTFAPGQSRVTLDVRPVDDGVAESTESVVVTLAAGARYDLTPSRAAATVNIADNEPVVSVRASASATEGLSTPGAFTLRRTGSFLETLDVRLRVGGSAVLATDYNFISGDLVQQPTLDADGYYVIVRFAAGRSTCSVRFLALTDGVPEPDETVTLALLADAGFTYGFGPVAGAWGPSASGTVRSR